MSDNIKNFDLTSFKRANNGMISKNDSVASNGWGSRIIFPKKNYTLQDVEKILSSGNLCEKIKLSRDFFYNNGLYKRLIIHYATLLKYSGVLIPNPSFGKSLSTPHINKRYFSAVDFVERLNIPVLLTGFAQRALVDGCYYGLLQKATKEGVTVLDLPSNWCQTRFKDIYGNDIIEFDVSYFNTITDDEERRETLSLYPKIVSSAYKKWKRGERTSKLVVIPSEIGLCFPFFTDVHPIFLSVISEVLRYDDTVEIELERNIEEIRKVLVQKIPHLNDGRLLFEPDEAEEMHAGAVGMLKGNKNISVLTTYAEVDAISSKTSNEANNNTVERMMQNVYNKSGTSSELFASTGSSTLESSIDNDAALMMVLANKFSLFLTNLINRLFANSNIDFKYVILPITNYNVHKYVDTSLKLASSGYSLLLPSLAMGFSQKDLVNIKDLENDVLSLTDKLIPPQTSYTQNGEGTTGAPKKEQSEKNPRTLENEKSLDNQTGGGSN